MTTFDFDAAIAKATAGAVVDETADTPAGDDDDYPGEPMKLVVVEDDIGETGKVYHTWLTKYTHIRWGPHLIPIDSCVLTCASTCSETSDFS